MENGTHGKKWYTEEENNIAFSLALEVNCEVTKLEGVTLEIANILVLVFQKLYDDITLEIKYPNDLIYQGKKIGGILTETKLKGKVAKWMVIGIGINTNQEKFPEEIKNIATSIKKEFHLKIDNEKVIAEFCNLWEKMFLEMK